MAEGEIRSSRPFLSGCVGVQSLKSPVISCSLSQTLMVITAGSTPQATAAEGGGAAAGAVNSLPTAAAAGVT
ncbi:hypothetical protein PBY51_006623 [Eleginops maclovinus]|uniref:Uncharacterized protein n=1 Tax=Eleginops maclovinus TaxID=56733 RepID=A0AAN7X0A0_ELEMC|nr:hypothetical protein PBY51_006623 [Eleginops maclovinus]